MSIAHYLKEIGRGHEGARPLSPEQATDLMDQVLARRVSDLEIGAFALAMRVKGETTEELAGFLHAAHQHTQMLAVDRPTLVIPSYNGARRLPNLTPLLALMLAQSGVPVLVHGAVHDPGRVTTAEIFQALDLPACESQHQIRERWQRQQPAFVSTAWLNPALQGLLDVRRIVGLRNSGHTIAKLLQPLHGAPGLRLCSYTHPEFGLRMRELAERTAADLMVLRGTEGEAVVDARRCPRIDTWLGGRWRAELSCPAQEGTLTDLPLLPRQIDAATTAVYIQAVLAGEKPAPAPIARQVALLQLACQTLATGADLSTPSLAPALASAPASLPACATTVATTAAPSTSTSTSTSATASAAPASATTPASPLAAISAAAG